MSKRGQDGQPGTPGRDGGGDGGAGGRGGDADTGVSYGTDQDWVRSTVWWGYLLAVLVCTVLSSIAWAKVHNQQVVIRTQQAQIAKQALAGKRSADANCALAQDLSDRAIAAQIALAQSRQFFKDHPHALGDIPRSLIAQGFVTQQKLIDGQIRTIRVLKKKLVTCVVKVPKS